MSGDVTCPECGEPVSATASYCMHCYADLPSSPAGDDADGSTDRGWGDTDNPDPTNENVADPTQGASPDQTDPTATVSESADAASSGGSATTSSGGTDTTTGGSDPMLDPDGIVDNTLTVIVGVAGGIVVGIVAIVVLLVMTGSAWAIPLGFLTWLVATAYLSRQRTVQGAIAHTCFAIAVVLLAFPFIAWSPVVDASSLGDRVGFFFFSFITVAFPAAIVGGIGYVVSKFTPETGSRG